VLPADNERLHVIPQADGSVTFIPKGSQYDLEVVLQAVEVLVDDKEAVAGDVVDTAYATVRPYKTPRRTIWIKRPKEDE
jgi:hypothetical protein